MKKLRYIPLLSLVGLLSGCNLFGGGTKAPTFAKEGTEVSYSEFLDAFNEAKQNSEVADGESKLGDRVFKVSTSDSYSVTTKRGKEEVNKDETKYAAKGEGQYDYGNLVAKITSEVKTSEARSYAEGSYTSSSDENYEQYLQFEKVNSATYMIVVNVKSQEYRTSYSVTGRTTKEDIFDSEVRSGLISYVNQFESEIPGTVSVARDYLFFNDNDTLFTFSLNKEQEDNNDSYFNCVYKTKLKVQIDLTNKKESFKYSYEYRAERTYKKRQDSHLAGDVEVEERTYYIDFSCTAKDCNVKAIDISDYTLVGNY